jgi:signal peptidase II
VLKFRNYVLLAVLAGLVFTADQVSKELVRTGLAFGEIWMPWKALEPYFHIVHWSNTGAAFGIFQQGHLIFTILAVVVSAAIIYYYRNSDSASWPVRIALGLQLGGALGNLADRLLHQGSVTDFLWFSFFPAVSNVADLSISLGVALLLLDILLENRRSRAAGQPPAPVAPPQGTL